MYYDLRRAIMPCKTNESMKCPCTDSCVRRGKCCECVAFHRKNRKFPACFFSAEAERTYDRSYAALKKDREGGE